MAGTGLQPAARSGSRRLHSEQPFSRDWSRRRLFARIARSVARHTSRSASDLDGAGGIQALAKIAPAATARNSAALGPIDRVGTGQRTALTRRRRPTSGFAQHPPALGIRLRQPQFDLGAELIAIDPGRAGVLDRGSAAQGPLSQRSRGFG